MYAVLKKGKRTAHFCFHSFAVNISNLKRNMTIIFGHCLWVNLCTSSPDQVQVYVFYFYDTCARSFWNEQFAGAHFFHPQILLLLVGFKNGFDLFLCVYANIVVRCVCRTIHAKQFGICLSVYCSVIDMAQAKPIDYDSFIGVTKQGVFVDRLANTTYTVNRHCMRCIKLKFQIGVLLEHASEQGQTTCNYTS